MGSRPGIIVGFLLPAIAVWGGGCRDDTGAALDQPVRNDAEGIIAFVGAGPDDPLWSVLKAGAEQSTVPGLGLEVRYFTPASGSARAQAELLAGMDQSDLRGLCIQVKDPEAIAPVLQRLRNQGVTIVSMVEPAPEQSRFAHVGLDETAVGRELARCTIQGLARAGGTIMVLHAGYTHPIYGPRYLAFSETIKRAANVTVLAEIDCGADPHEARRIIRERSERFPRLTAWVSIDDWPLQNGYPAEELFHPPTRYITFGGQPRHWPLITRGICPCILAAEYGQVGAKALQYCQSGARNASQEKRIIYVPLRTLTLISLEDYQSDWRRWTQGRQAPPPPEQDR